MSNAVVAGLHHYLIEVLTTAEAGRIGRSDESQLEFATGQGRVVYTSNAGDFARLHAEWQRAGRTHAGIIILFDQRTPIGVQIRALLRMTKALTSTEMRNRLEYLGDWTVAS